jgi:WD40 repeat protein
MRYVVAGLFSLCLGLLAGAGAVAADAQPAQRSWLLFVRDEKVWAVTSDGAETKGPLVTDEPVSALNVSPDGRYLAAINRGRSELRIFRLLPGFEVAEVEGPQAGLSPVVYWRWSPDARYLAVVIEANPHGRYPVPAIWEPDELRIFRVRPDLPLEEVERLRPGLVRVGFCWWSPDGRYLTITTRRLAAVETPGGAIPPPTATPDDDRPCFRSLTWTEEAALILPWRGDGEGLFDQPPLVSVPSGHVLWSPRSDAIAYPRPTGDRNLFPDGICVTDVASGHTTPIKLADRNSLHDLTWSPDGRVFTYGGGDGVRSVPADGSARESLLVEGKGQWYAGPCWSPDGTFLAYARSWGANGSGVPLMGLWILDTRSGANTRLTGDGAHVDSDSYRWSHDGTQVSFFGEALDPNYERNDHALYVADPAAGTVTRVAGGFPSLPSPAVWLRPGAPWGDED